MLPRPISRALAVAIVLRIVASAPGQEPQRQNPLADVYSGKALNNLLQEIALAHGKGQRGPVVSLDAALLRRINIGLADGANIGLLLGQSTVPWPKILREEKLQGPAAKVEALLMRGLTSLRQDPTKPLAKPFLSELADSLDDLVNRLNEQIADLTPSQYIEAKRFLNRLGDTANALKKPAAGHFVDGTIAACGTSVAELSDYLQRHGFVVVSALEGQEVAYKSLFHLLKAYEAKLVSR
jgi:hypothetical protein